MSHGPGHTVYEGYGCEDCFWEHRTSKGEHDMTQISVLDHGYVKFVESWGTDESIIEAARMSTDKGFQGWGDEGRCSACGEQDRARRNGRCGGVPSSSHVWAPYVGDEKLLKYLYDNKHMTPFEMGGLTIEVQAPIFVFREWHRHRTQGYNELSARYTPMPDINYIPSVERLMINAGGTNKQAGTVKGSGVLTIDRANRFRDRLADVYAHDELMYQEALEDGVPKELARVHLPVGRYSRMRATANLRNWLGFLTLRMDMAAQWEIRQFANAVGILIASSFPRTWLLFDRGVK